MPAPQRNEVEQIVTTVSAFDRAACVAQLRRLRLPLDFTDAYLAGVNLEQLRHLVLAATLQALKHGQAVDSHAAS